MPGGRRRTLRQRGAPALACLHPQALAGITDHLERPLEARQLAAGPALDAVQPAPKGGVRVRIRRPALEAVRLAGCRLRPAWVRLTPSRATPRWVHEQAVEMARRRGLPAYALEGGGADAQRGRSVLEGRPELGLQGRQ
jgi:hypothetical protein